ncbi:MAG: redoxin domain-containing protein [Thermoguttaceae bacterium]|nr:redoxin domain-containing protein [Thermoguttaceae bacterium]
MKSNWKIMSLVVSTAALLTGCEPPVDRNAVTPDAAGTESTASADGAAVSAPASEGPRLTDASMEIIPEALKRFTQLPSEETAAAMAAYLDLVSSSEFQEAALSMLQAQENDEEARIGWMAAQKAIEENKKLATDLILGAADATEEQYRAALLLRLDELAFSNASPESLEVEMKVYRDRAAAGRFPKLANLADLQLESVRLAARASSLLGAEEPKPEDLDAFYADYTAQVEKVLEADMLSNYQLQMILGLAQAFQDKPERVLEVFKKLNAALEKRTEEKWTQLRTMVSQRVERLEREVKIQSTTPEQVKEFLAPYLQLPEEMTAKNCAAYLALFFTEEFRETVQTLFAVRNEEVEKAVVAEIKKVEENSRAAADAIFKAEDASEEEFRMALNVCLHLAMAYASPEEKVSLAELKERYTALQGEVEKSRFPHLAPKAACYAEACGILEKAEPFFMGEAQPTPEQKDALYPELTKLAESMLSSDTLDGLPMEVFMQCMGLYRTEKEKIRPLCETMIQGLEGKTGENAEMLLSTMKMQLAMLDAPQGMNGGNAGAQDSAPSEPELTPEQLEEAKKKLEAYTVLPEDRSAASLSQYVDSLDGPEFQALAVPLFQIQEKEHQDWLTETMGRRNDSLKEALVLICKAEDATEEQFKDALQFRLDIMRSEKMRKNIEPDYAALTEEVKASRFPALVSMVEIDAASQALMDAANALFTGDSEPTAEQKDELFVKFSAYLDKVLAAGKLEGPQLQVLMQVSTIFAEDNAKIGEFCTKMLKGLEGKTDEQSSQMREMFQKRLGEIEFLTKPMEFTAPEGTSLEDLKKLVTEKIEIIMRSMRSDVPSEKLAEFLAAVEKFGNADLTAYTGWQIGLIRLIPSLSGPDLDLQAFKTRYLECVKTGTEKDHFNLNCLQMCLQMAVVAWQKPGNELNAEGKEAVLEMFRALLPVCDQMKTPEAERFRQEIQSIIAELEKPAEVPNPLQHELPEMPAETAPENAAAPANTDALPEAIQLEDAPAENAPAENAPAENAPAENAPAENAPAENAPAEEVVTPSESTSAVEEEESFEEEKDAQTVEESAETVEAAETAEAAEVAETAEAAAAAAEAAEAAETAAPAVEIPAPILALITAPENATTAQLGDFLERLDQNMQEIMMQLGQSSDQTLLLAVFEKAMENANSASDQILAAEDAEKEVWEHAFAMKLGVVMTQDTQDPQTAPDLVNELQQLKTTVEKSKFPERAAAVEAMQKIMEFEQKTSALDLEDLGEEERAKLMSEVKTLSSEVIKACGDDDETVLQCLLSTMEFCFIDDVLQMEVVQILLDGMKEKEGAFWSEYTSRFEQLLERLKIQTQPIEFTVKDGAAQEELRAAVAEKTEMIFTSMQGTDLLKKMEELKAAVAKLGNEDLNAYTAWQTELCTIFQDAIGGMMEEAEEELEDGENAEEADGPELLAQLNGLADRAKSLKVSEADFMRMLQISISILNFAPGTPEEKAGFMEKLLELAKTYDSEEMKQLLPLLEQAAGSLRNPPEEDAETEAMPDPEAMAAQMEAMKAELDAATKPYLTLPENADAEKMAAFIEMFEGPEFEALVTAMQQFPDPQYAHAQFEQMVENLQTAVDFVLNAEDVSPEVLEKSLKMKLAWLSAEGTKEDAEALKAQIAKRELPRLTQLVECWEETQALREFIREKMQTGEITDADEAEFLTKAKELLQKCVEKKCFDGFQLSTVFAVSEILTAPEQKVEILQALREAVAAQKMEDGEMLDQLLAQKIAEIESAAKPENAEKQPETEAIPEAIDLDAGVSSESTSSMMGSASAAGEAEASSSAVTVSVSTADSAPAENGEAAGVSPEAAAEASELQIPQGATTEEIQQLVLKRMVEVLQSNPDQPMEKLMEVQKSVEKLGNEDVTQFAAWNIHYFHFFRVKLRQADRDADLNALSEDFVKIVRVGTKMRAFRTETLANTVQFAMYFASMLDEAHTKALLEAVTEALKSSSEPWAPQAQAQLAGKLTQMMLPGNPLVLEAETLDGKPVKIQDFVGKTVLVDVWATWCDPCCAEIPNMRKAYDAFHDAGFEIIGLSVDSDLDRLRTFVEKEQLPWIVAVENIPEGSEIQSFSDRYGITGIPAMFLVGADGKVLTVKARGRLMELLSEIYPEAAAKAAEAERKAAEELENSLKLDAPEAEALEKTLDEDVSSQSMSTTENSVENAADGQLPAVLAEFSKLPETADLDTMRDFLQQWDLRAYEVQTALTQMDEASAFALFEKIMKVRGQAADAVIADPNAGAEDLKLAVEVKSGVILFLNQQTMDLAQANADFDALVKVLDARNAQAAVVQAQVAQLMGTSHFAAKMPGLEEMEQKLDRLAEICVRAKAAKCMDGDMMGHFMQMVVYANDVGVTPEKINRTCAALRDAVVATGDPQLLNTADFLTGMARRATLPGKKMELVGVTLDGQEVDIQKDYAGKVVLVDFWATWCNPCVMELTNLERQYYAKYHEKGFEILGFSIDVDRNQLRAFLERRKLPWQTILQKDGAAGCEEPVYYYGIQAIPCLILVGPDGKVIREIPTMRRDEVLVEELKKIYGE